MKRLLFLFLFFIFVSFCFAESSYGDSIVEENYKVSRSVIDRVILQGSFFEDYISIDNLGSSSLNIDFEVSEGVLDVVIFPDGKSYEILPEEGLDIPIRLKGGSIGNYVGEVTVSGSVNEVILVNLTISEVIDDPLYVIQSADQLAGPDDLFTQ